MQISSYPKVYNIGHAAVADLFKDGVIVEEKVDGSQFSFMVDEEGKLTMRSHGAPIYEEAPEKMFSLAVGSVVLKKNLGILHPNWIYRTEFLRTPKHNVLAYSRVPAYNLILFDVQTGEETYLNRYLKEEEAIRIGLEVVPILASGPIDSPETLMALLDNISVLGGPKVEGIVVKNYVRFGRDSKALMGKFVSETFKEKHSKEWKADNPQLGDIIDRIIAELRHTRRWEKAVEKLRDLGTLEKSPRDIGNLIKIVKEDVAVEETDYIKDKLLTYALPRIIRASTGGLPEWYKEKLLRDAFNP